MSNNYLTDEEIEKFFKDRENGNATNLTCQNCGKSFAFDAPGTRNRNHCPYCLFSVHVDEKVGDRKSTCQGLMEPIGKFLRPNGEEVLVHKCIECGKMSNNRVAGDDDFEKVSELFIIDETDVDGIF